MIRNKILVGLTAAAAATALSAPAAFAQDIISPAQPSTPTNVQPQGAAVHIDSCKVARSSHGYTYAVCPVVATNVAYNTTITVPFRSALTAFKPRTNGTWSTTTGALTLSSKGTPGMQPGQTTEVIGGLKFAYQGKSVAQVKKSLIVTIEAGKGDYITQPVAGASGR
jgi:hypothetical protein